MGVVLAKFRKTKTTEAVLEGLDEKIRQIEKYSLNTQEQKKKFVGNFLAISIGVYVVAFIVFYFVYFPPTWKERAIYSVPLLLFPLVIILLRKLFTWYFQRKLNKNSNKLTVLRDEKKKILEQVMDKETYKVAVKLLKRFGDSNMLSGGRYSLGMTPRVPSSASLNQTLRSSSNTLNTTANMRNLNASVIATPRQIIAPSLQSAGGALVPRQLALSPQARNAGNVGGNMNAIVPVGAGQELRRRTPFPIVNQHDKGVFERIVDVLIGDGPQDRFAMICKQCYAHNGMALKEDFDYKTFRCAFCNNINPSRKARPIAPRLPVQQIGLSPVRARQNSSGSSTSSSDVDSDKDITAFERRPVPRIETTETHSPAAVPSSAVAEECIEDFEHVERHSASIEAMDVEEENGVDSEEKEEKEEAKPKKDEELDSAKLKDEFKKEM